VTSGILWLIAIAGIALIGVDAVLYLVLRIRAAIASSTPRRAVSDAARELHESARPLLADETLPAPTRGAIDALLVRTAEFEHVAARVRAGSVPADEAPAVEPQGAKGLLSRFPLIVAGIALVVLAALLGGLNFSFAL
jgi:hypothetical protein